MLPGYQYTLLTTVSLLQDYIELVLRCEFKLDCNKSLNPTSCFWGCQRGRVMQHHFHVYYRQNSPIRAC